MRASIAIDVPSPARVAVLRLHRFFRVDQQLKEVPVAQDMAGKPQTEKKHPDEWERDLNPDRMAGQNIGGEAEARERDTRTAYDVKSVHRAFADFSDDELKQIPVLDRGTRLRQGATYLDLSRGRFVASGDMAVGSDQLVVPKDRVHYETWNRLAGEEKP